MSKVVSFEHRDRLIQLGIAISTLRRIRGMSQEKLAEEANVSRSVISMIEAPNCARNFTIEVLFSIADVLDISPGDLLNASVFPDNVIKNEKKLLTDTKSSGK